MIEDVVSSRRYLSALSNIFYGLVQRVPGIIPVGGERRRAAESGGGAECGGLTAHRPRGGNGLNGLQSGTRVHC